MSADTRVVYFYTCDCAWISNYCETEHTASARIPLDVLEQYRSQP